jgi:DNA-binding GntR family transcriptional regulator
MTVYDRIAHSLRDRILTGHWSRGEKLPTERELCTQFGASRITIRRALEILDEELLVERRQGAGTFVTGAASRRIPIIQADFCGSMARHAPDLARRLEMHEWLAADAGLSVELQVGTGDQVLHAQRIDSLRGQPVAVDDLLIPRAQADRLKAADLTEIDFLRRWQKVQRMGLDFCRQTVEADLIRRPFAGHLGLRSGQPVLKETSRFHLAGGRPAGIVVSYYRHDYFRFDLTVPLTGQHEQGPPDPAGTAPSGS